MAEVRRYFRRTEAAASVVLMLLVMLAVLWPHVHRPVWNDEAWLVDYSFETSLQRGWGRALEDRLAAAPGYVAVLWAVRHVSPTIEAYRLTSVAALAAALLLGGLFLGQLAGRVSIGMAAATLLLASPLFQQYGTEIKQYMTGAAVTLALFWLTERWLSVGSAKYAVLWFLAALAALLVAFASWFAVAACGLVLAIAWTLRRSWRRLAWTAAMGLGVAVTAGLLWFTFVRHIGGNQETFDYWQQYMLPLDAGFPAALWRLLVGDIHDSWRAYPSLPASLLAICGIAGMAAWCGVRPKVGCSVVALAAVMVLAALLRRWPLAPRTALNLGLAFHLGVLAVPMVLARLWLYGVRSSPGARRVATWTPWLALLAVACVAPLMVMESRDADYTVAAGVGLLDAVAESGDADDLVLMDWAAHANYRLKRPAIAGPVERTPFITADTIDDYFLPAITSHRGDVLLAVGHHNAELAAQWQALAEALAGTFDVRVAWRGHHAALYVCTRRDAAPDE